MLIPAPQGDGHSSAQPSVGVQPGPHPEFQNVSAYSLLQQQTVGWSTGSLPPTPVGRAKRRKVCITGISVPYKRSAPRSRRQGRTSIPPIERSCSKEAEKILASSYSPDGDAKPSTMLPSSSRPPLTLHHLCVSVILTSLFSFS